jgi:hypothetical protein
MFAPFHVSIDAFLMSLKSINDSERAQFMETMYTKIESLAHCVLIWKTAAECIYQGMPQPLQFDTFYSQDSSQTTEYFTDLPIHLALESLKNEILPQSIDASKRLLTFLSSEFDKALTTWEVFDSDRDTDLPGLVLVTKHFVQRPQR